METDNADVGSQATEPTGNEATTTQSAPEFVIPAEYQEKGWAKNIKSEADLWKGMDNAQSLIGKKTIGIPDFENAKDEELADYYTHTRPKDSADYEIGEQFSDEEKKALQSVFYDNGLTKTQAKNVLAKIQDGIDKDVAENYGETGLKAEFEQRFGKEWEKEIVPVKDTMKAVFTEEQLQAINELPNKAIGSLFAMTKQIMAKYGANETDASTAKDRNVKPKLDYGEFYKKMKDADSRGDMETKKQLMKQYYGE